MTYNHGLTARIRALPKQGIHTIDTRAAAKLLHMSVYDVRRGVLQQLARSGGIRRIKPGTPGRYGEPAVWRISA